MNSFATFAQDSWRVSPALTVNYGLRWDIQRPFTPLSNIWSTATMADLCGVSGIGSGPGGRGCNLFQPGNLAGGASFVPSYTAFTPGTSGYETDWNNFAPNVGVAWRPNVQGGFLRRLLGDPDQATVRAGYAVSYSLERLDRFSSLYGDNPGGEIAATRNYTTGFPMLGPGETAPVLLRDRARLGPPAFPSSPVYPIAALPSNELNVFDANLEHAKRAVLLGRPPAIARARHGARGALRRQQESPRLVRRGLERRGALRERLHRRVQGGAGQPRRARRAGLRRHRHLLVRLSRPGNRHDPAADLPRVFPGHELVPGRRRGELHQRELPQLGLDGAPRLLRAGSGRCGQRPAREPDVPGERADSGTVAELLRDESGREPGQYHAFGERHALSLAAGRAAPPADQRPDGERQLHLGEQDAVGVHVPAGRRPLGADGSGLPQQHRHPAFVQGQLAVGAAVRQGTPLRRGHERLRQRARRRLGFFGDRTIPDAAVLDPRGTRSSA